MYLPKLYQDFMEKHSEIFDDYKKLGKTCRDAGPLDSKTQDLIKLGMAIGIDSKGAIMSHTRKALTSGASVEEIIHTVILGLTTVGFPHMMAAMSWVNEVLSEKTSGD